MLNIVVPSIAPSLFFLSVLALILITKIMDVNHWAVGICIAILSALGGVSLTRIKRS